MYIVGRGGLLSSLPVVMVVTMESSRVGKVSIKASPWGVLGLVR